MRGGPVSGLFGTSYLGSEIRFGGIVDLIHRSKRFPIMGGKF